MWSKALALSFGVMKVTDIAKEVFTRTTGLTPQPYLKSVVASTVAVGAAVLYADGWRDRMLLASAVAGGSAALHEVYAVLTTASDKNKAGVLSQVGRARAAAVSAGAPGQRIRAL